MRRTAVSSVCNEPSPARPARPHMSVAARRARLPVMRPKGVAMGPPVVVPRDERRTTPAEAVSIRAPSRDQGAYGGYGMVQIPGIGQRTHVEFGNVIAGIARVR